jgi:hypothetical protein
MFNWNETSDKDAGSCHRTIWGDRLRRTIRVLLVGGTLTLAVALLNPLAKADPGLKLHPSGFGEKSQAAWKAKEGLPDSKGNALHALYFQKFTTTATFAAGIAVINGLEGQPVSKLTGLSWEHRNDGHCGAGAPRWNLGVTNGTQTYTVFLGCAAAAHTPGSAANWTRDSYPGPAIQAQILAQTGLVSTTGLTITSLAIVFDEGTDQGQGFVYLDNITVNTHVWTGPADNGS